MCGRLNRLYTAATTDAIVKHYPPLILDFILLHEEPPECSAAAAVPVPDMDRRSDPGEKADLDCREHRIVHPDESR
jgi:hypothetical protein